MSDPTGTVFVVDDDKSFLVSIARLLRASGFSVKTYASAADLLSDLGADARGCVVIDLKMPGMNGIELQDQLGKSDRNLPVVFLTGQGDIPTSVAAMRGGAEDFLTKLAPKQHLVSAVRRALERGEREGRERARRREVQARFDKLTPRDHEVLHHILRGQLNKQIAAHLGINERSVKRHRTSLMTKLQVASVAELSHLAHEAGTGEPSHGDMGAPPAPRPGPPRP